MTREKKFAMPKIVSVPEDDERRRPGPMAVAGRESAEAVSRMVEEQAEARRRNADDADAYRAAQADGLVLVRLALDDVRLDDLPRDRMALDLVATSPEMDELKASIRVRGQKEAIEVYRDATGAYQLKKGWRRLEALRQLSRESGEERFATVLARVIGDRRDRAALYIDMVEENAIREDVSFAEMAHVAIVMAEDPATGVASVEEAVDRLYGALQKVKRSNIRRFVDLLRNLGDVLPAPRAVPKNLGADVARLIAADQAAAADLRRRLKEVDSAEAQNEVLAACLASAKQSAGPTPTATQPTGPRQKFEFHHLGMKITGRPGECRIKSEVDFAAVPRERLEAAVAAFHARLME